MKTSTTQPSGCNETRPLRGLVWALAFTTAATLVLYGLGALLQTPPSGPDGFIPKTLAEAARPAPLLAQLSPGFVVVYAFSFLPVVALFVASKYRSNPCGVMLGACLLVPSLFIEILNALPMVSRLLIHPRTTGVPPETLLYVMQSDAAGFLALDVAGFTLGYLGVAVLAVVFRREEPWVARLTLASIVLFLANVPFLWIQPWVAVLLMVGSILAFAALPPLMARSALLAVAARADSRVPHASWSPCR